jgi:predicted enzyme related to lactoylglutathione lyase
MPNLHGDFIWYELMTPDPSGAKAFYDAVLDWTVAAKGNPMPGGSEYREIMAQDGNHAGGVLTLTGQMAEAGSRPAWFGYVGVDDVDTLVANAQERGATLFMGPTDMEGVGRMAMLADPQGAPFYVMRGFPGGESKAYQTMTPGHVAWNELNTSDFDRGRGFYYDLFGWTDGEAMPMGELGTYQLFDQNGQSIGAISPLLGETRPGWLFYFAVEEIDRARKRVSAHGGTLLQEPQEIPGGMFSVNARDPQGALFAMVGPREG